MKITGCGDRSSIKLTLKITLFLSVLMTLLVCAAVSASALEQKRRVVRVGYYEAPGFQDYDPKTGTHSGYAYEYYMALAQYAGWEYYFVRADFQDCLKLLKEGKIDIVSNVTQTPERLDYLDYSEEGFGHNETYIAMSPEDRRVSYDEYRSLEHLTIGLRRKSFYNEKFFEFCHRHGFTMKVRYYNTSEEIEKALKAHEIDARLVTSTRNLQIHAVARIYSEEMHFAVRKGNSALLNELDHAMRVLDTWDNGLEERLRARFYGSKSERGVILTESERFFIKGHPVINVYYRTAWPPLSYEKNGNFCGVMRELYNILEKNLNVRFHYIPIPHGLGASGDFGRNSLIVCTPTDYSFARSIKVSALAPILEFRYMIVSRNDMSAAAIKTVALPENYYVATLARSVYGGRYEYLSRPDAESCLEAVLSGAADGTVLDVYQTAFYQGNYKYKPLQYIMSRSLHSGLSVGVSTDSDPRLSSIMLKAIRTLSYNDTSTFLYETLRGSESTDLVSWFYRYPASFLSAAVLSSMALLYLVFLTFYARLIRRKNQQLRTAKEAANKAKASFLSRISHDMRTPMNAVIGFSRLGLEARNPTEAAEYLKNINVAGSYLLGLINDVLDMSKIESGKMELHTEPYKYSAFEKAIRTIIEPRAKEKGVSLRIYSECQGDSAAMLDKQRIQQVIVNLLSNAVKFTPRGGHIECQHHKELTKDGKLFIRFVVRDDGIGMSEDFMENMMYRPFEQDTGRGKGTTEESGTGLGLSIVKSIVTLMGGTINCESTPGKGTVFTVNLIAELAPKETSLEDKSTDSEGFLRGKRVLLCEDHPLNTQLATKLLEKRGVAVTCAANGEEGLCLFEAMPSGYFDAILMDIRMPVMDGLEASRRIRALTDPWAALIPIIALSANAFEDDSKRSQASGINAHLAKPIDPKLLYEILTKFIAESEQRRDS